MPLEPEGPQIVRGVEAPASAEKTFPWYHMALALLFCVFCFVLGVFLLVFPWLDLWENNYFAALAPSIRATWSSPFLKGAVSGLGVVNIYLSFVEIFRLRRFSGGDGLPMSRIDPEERG